MTLVKYSSNNSGGNWWLTDQNWKDLEAAGWNVEWVAEHPRTLFTSKQQGDRWLGALATSATREADSLRSAIEEWERITGERSNDLGCSCCGTPHSFSTDDGEYYTPDYPSYGEPY